MAASTIEQEDLMAGIFTRFLADYDRSIALVGLGNSGKTVFLTSLIDHLKNHGQGTTPLVLTSAKQGETVQITHFEEIKEKHGFEKFPFAENRRKLAEKADWPEKTEDVYEFGCRFKRSDWSRDVRLRFLDMPGERIQDFEMRDRDYGQWSDFCLELWGQDAESRGLVQGYLKLLDSQSADVGEDGILRAYKVLLGRFYLGYRAFITPSYYLLDGDGATIPDVGDPEGWADFRFSGRKKGEEFAPLPAHVRAQQPELCKKFSERYDTYKETVPEKIFRKFAGCHRLIILVDIPTTLAASTARYNDQVETLESILKACRAGKRWLAIKLLDIVVPYFKLPGISRIALVATKADMVRVGETGKLRKLLEEMTRNTVKDFDVESRYFTCAAIQSTVPVGDSELQGYTKMDEEHNLRAPPQGDEPKQRFEVCSLPDSWPEDWKPGNYRFVEVYPTFPKKRNTPPVQEGLGPILDFLLDENIIE